MEDDKRRSMAGSQQRLGRYTEKVKFKIDERRC